MFNTKTCICFTLSEKLAGETKKISVIYKCLKIEILL